MDQLYCTYLTSYFGNKLPPFYIGYTTVANINRGYRGSVSSKSYKSIWLSELKHNPHLFTTKIISLHESRKDALNKEMILQTYVNAHTNPMYINRCISNTKFYNTPGYFLTESTKLKISKSLIGKPKSMITINKIKIARKGKGTGVRNSMASDIHRSTQKKIIMEKYGVQNVFQNEDIKTKIKETNLLKYGINNPMQSNELKGNYKRAMFLKYGVDNIQKIRTSIIWYNGEIYTGSILMKMLSIKLSKIGYLAHNKLEGFMYC